MHVSEKANIIFQDEYLSGKQIREQILIYKAFLEEQDWDPDIPVALLVQRSPKLVALICAMLDLGIVFLPINIEQPIERIRYMLHAAGVKKSIRDSAWNQLDIFKDIQFIHLDDMRQEDIKGGKRKKIKSRYAYVLFTSCTTGQSKAVLITRKNFDNFAAGFVERIKFCPEKSILSCANLAFDIFLVETIIAIDNGMTVVMAAEEERKNPAVLVGLIKRWHIDMIQTTPSMLTLLNMHDTRQEYLKYISVIMLGGEKLSENLLYMLQKKSHALIYNLYGLTETTVWSMVADLTKEDTIHIGEAISNTDVFLLDEKLQPVKKGREGEIVIAGAGLADKYLNDEPLTRRKFCYLATGERVCLTGDIGRIDEQGRLICMGRKDQQIKLHGQGVKLEEIESVIASMQCIKGAAVCYSSVDDEEYLSAFYIADETIEVSDVRSFLKEHLAGYMIPRHLCQVEEFLYNENGKLDRNAMVQLYGKKKIVPTLDQKDSDMQVIIKIIQELLEVEGCLSEDTLLEEMGMDSLAYVNTIIQLEEAFHIEFGVECLSQDFFQTIGNILQYIRENK